MIEMSILVGPWKYTLGMFLRGYGRLENKLEKNWDLVSHLVLSLDR